MPTVTIEESVTLQDAAKALQQKLGNRYEVTTHGSGSHEELKVKQSAATTATVQLSREGDATTFHVHGGGLVISRMVNEFGIAKKVAATIKEAFEAAPPSGATPSAPQNPQPGSAPENPQPESAPENPQPES